jgi:hypothetical protein
MRRRAEPEPDDDDRPRRRTRKKKLKPALPEPRRLRRWDLNYILVVVVLLFLASGITAIVGLVLLYDTIGTKPEPAELTLDELVNNGHPPGNAHVRLSNCAPGEQYAVIRSDKGGSSDSYVPFFGEKPDASGKVPMIVVSTSGRVDELYNRPTVTGIVRGGIDNRALYILRREYPDRDFDSAVVLVAKSSVPSRATALVVLAVSPGLAALAAALILLHNWLKKRRLRDEVAIPD